MAPRPRRKICRRRASSKTDHRRLAASSRWRALESATAGRGHLLAGPGRAGDRADRRAVRTAPGPRPGHRRTTSQHHGRQEFGRDIGQPTGADGVVSEGLSTTVFAGRDGRRELLHAIIIVVPRCTWHTPRLARAVRRRWPGHVLTGTTCLSSPRRRRRKTPRLSTIGGTPSMAVSSRG